MVPARAAGRRSLEVIRSNPGLAACRAWPGYCRTPFAFIPPKPRLFRRPTAPCSAPAILTSREFIQCNCVRGIYPSSSSSGLDLMTAGTTVPGTGLAGEESASNTRLSTARPGRGSGDLGAIRTSSLTIVTFLDDFRPAHLRGHSHLRRQWQQQTAIAAPCTPWSARAVASRYACRSRGGTAWASLRR